MLKVAGARLLGRVDGFLAAMVAAVGLALLAPRLGTSDGPLHLGPVTAVGIALIFFLHGARLSRERLVAGASHWRLHLFVQGCTFVLFPMLGIALAGLLGDRLPAALVTGVVYLCMLPSTISSSVAFTVMAGGNTAAAVFNATLSNFIGMLLTPLMIGQWLHAAGDSLPLGRAVLGVAVQLLLPFALGQALRPRLAAALARYPRLTGNLDRGVIVLIVYVSFCDSAAAGLWSGTGAVLLLQALLLAAALLFVVLSLTRMAAPRLGFACDDEIVAVFCGSKKSVSSGIAMARLLFGARPELGLILLPAMLYHQLQLFACAALARRYAAQRAAQAA